MITRVIGVGCEHVAIRDGSVWIDGTRIEEDYTYSLEPTFPTGTGSEWNVPEGSLFVMGDHRQGSNDSRNTYPGFVETDWVVGRAWLRFFPLDTLGILQTPEYPELETAE